MKTRLEVTILVEIETPEELNLTPEELIKLCSQQANCEEDYRLPMYTEVMLEGISRTINYALSAKGHRVAQVQLPEPHTFAERQERAFTLAYRCQVHVAPEGAPIRFRVARD